jgi:hypothetical protein
VATGGGEEEARPLIETTRERVGPTGPAVKAGGRLFARLTFRDSGSARVRPHRRKAAVITDTRTALVIGGGIAGPLAAMAPQEAGVEGTVYEAYHSTADGVGGGLSVAPNGLNALGVLGADEVVRRIGMPMTAMVIQSWTKREGDGR